MDLVVLLPIYMCIYASYQGLIQQSYQRLVIEVEGKHDFSLTKRIGRHEIAMCSNPDTH